MPIIGFIVVGDRTSHGGEVISSSSRRSIDDIPMARVGDPVSCPRCKRETKILSSRFPQMTDNGVAFAFDQDVTDCGAVLYSRHNNHAGYGSDDAPAPAAKAAPVPMYQARPASRVQEHFVLQDGETGEKLAGVKYTLTIADGRAGGGETDRYGRTGEVWTDTAVAARLAVERVEAAGDDPYHYCESNAEDA
ncbi:MAG: PAAR domain-containing protein [Pseudomonadota bacterium]